MREMELRGRELPTFTSSDICEIASSFSVAEEYLRNVICQLSKLLGSSEKSFDHFPLFVLHSLFSLRIQKLEGRLDQVQKHASALISENKSLLSTILNLQTALGAQNEVQANLHSQPTETACSSFSSSASTPEVVDNFQVDEVSSETGDSNSLNSLPNRDGYACPYPACKKICSQRSNLTAHIRRCHEKRRGYACTHPGCDKAFFSAYDLKRHMSSHNLISAFPCMMSGCSKSFRGPAQLQRHLRNTHGIHRPRTARLRTRPPDIPPS
eukprot:GCRY01001592.1.p1 GENE.GCRY01001592.1~~GCRY01001592.1.p1  ORF type:complete len:268 (+),score=13.12 GCRY01001592.1:40-843(+)